MKFSISKTSPSQKGTNTLVVFTTAGAKGKKLSTSFKDKTVTTLIEDANGEGAFSGNLKETLFCRNANVDGYSHVVLVGMGEDKNSTEAYRVAAAALYSTLTANKVTKVDLSLSSLGKVKKIEEAVGGLTEGFLYKAYTYDACKTAKKEYELKSVSFLDEKTAASLKKAVAEAETLASAVNFSRMLGDAPGNKMTPEILAKTTQKEAKGSGLKVTIWDKARIKKEKMGGLLGVSLGGGPDPRFIIMEYNGAAKSKKPVCFVGKGLTFDSGGISIKPSAGMDEMKYDMCGGANVIGAMMAIAKLKLKVNAIAFVPSTENMPGPFANKPGDILTARNGKTVEVLNTDAEGRLILMDALSYASEKKPAAIFDAATLTGAMVMALGNSYTGFFTRDAKLRGTIEKAANASGEKVWAMPICDDHVADMKGRHADLSNLSGFRGAGSSTAAAFLEQFVEKDIPWAHFDIAGTAWNCGNRINYYEAKGATGAIVRTFVELAKAF